MKPQAYIIGVGPGGSDFLTERARDRIARSHAILGWDLDLVPVKGLLAGKEIYLQSVKNYRQVAFEVAARFRTAGARVAILRIGDPCVSSGLRGLLDLFKDYEIEIVPGISSVQIAASLARINLDEAVVITFHESGDIEARMRFMRDALLRGRHLLMLSGEELRPDAAARYLIEQGIDESLPVLVGERLTLPDENIVRTTLSGLREIELHWLTVVAVIQPRQEVRRVERRDYAHPVSAS